MKFIKPFIYAGLISVVLAGCGTANNNDRFTSDDNRPLGVRYNPDDNRNNDNTVNDDNQNIDLADDVAEKVTDLKEVDDAIVLVTNRNAYVAVKLSDQGDRKMTKDVQKKIARKVRDTNHDFDNVYISENPDFYDHMRRYVNDIRNGRPISGFFDEFTDIVQRVFPNAR